MIIQSASHPYSHTPALLLCVLITFSITSMTPPSPAFTLLSAMLFVLEVISFHLRLYLLPFSVMFQSALHPASHTPALLMCVLIASSIILMAPPFPAFTLLSTVLIVLEVISFHLRFYLFTIRCDVPQCITSLLPHASIVDVRPHHIQYHLNGSSFSCLYSVVSCVDCFGSDFVPFVLPFVYHSL